MLRCLALCVVIMSCAGSSLAAAEPVDYVRDIKPLLVERCYACHGVLQQKSGLRLDTVALARAGGDSGPAVVPGKIADSLIVERVTAGADEGRMPPEGEPLTGEQIDRLKRWIEAGALSPSDEKPEADPREHWSFRTPVRPAVPAVRNPAWVINPIDAFVAAGHEARGLTAQPAADKRTLLRRVYLDLIGLPPSREELAAFVADESPRAFEQVVDRLLASPQYGERWGRHWMDIWRYSDWWGLGAEVRNSQKHIWHWRDWIIESLNANVGYDEMVRQMFAADELYPTDPDKLRATGYLARNYFKFNRTTWLDETVEHMSKAFLGLTINCAKCHDHKYDPWLQTDYYQLRAFFEPYQVRMDQVPGESDYERDGIPRVFDCHLDAPTYLFVRGDEKQPKTSDPLSPGLPALFAPLLGELNIQPVSLPLEAHQPGLRTVVVENAIRAAETQVTLAQQALDAARKTLADAEAREVAASKTATAPDAGTAKPDDATAAGTADADGMIRDDFSAEKPERWMAEGGEWKYQDGKLLQTKDVSQRSAMKFLGQLPVDFQARVKFKITGGVTYKSVGLAFDVAEGHEVLAYLSPHGAGKLQIAYKKSATEYAYPADGTLVRAIQVGDLQDLLIEVRGTLVNVSLGGERVLAWRSPVPRKPGTLALITYDAQAEFTNFELRPLPASLVLAEPQKVAAPAAVVTVEGARQAVLLAERVLATAQAGVPAVRARAAADAAKYAVPAAADAAELGRAAARAERVVAAAKAAEELTRAEGELLQVKGDAAKSAAAEKKVAAAREAVTKAAAAVAVESVEYTSLRGAVKTVESPTETEAERLRPFPTTSTGRRTALARWMTDARHPLTARVAVNHLWGRHFGQPLVRSVFEFGRKGETPSHPELLDWLAVEFMEHGWNMKHMHRLMVLSNTYRLSSSAADAAEANLSQDGDNVGLWRMNAVRLEAEVVRDALLALSGDLDPKLGGPTVSPTADEQSRRRSLYFTHSNNDHHRLLSVFDEASVQECYRRADSIVPQQALALFNSRQALESSEKIARNLQGDAPLGDAEFVRAAFELVLSAVPNEAEQAACEQALAAFAKLPPAAGVDPALRARSNLVLALLNHNDFVTRR